MVMQLGETVRVMNELVATCKDGEQGYRQAIDLARNAPFKMICGQYAKQRAVFAGELQAAVRRMGAEPLRSGSVSGALRRGWLSITALATGKDDAAVLAACQRGEEATEENYRRALATELPAEVRLIAEAHHKEILNAQDRLRGLEISLQANAANLQREQRPSS